MRIYRIATLLIGFGLLIAFAVCFYVKYFGAYHHATTAGKIPNQSIIAHMNSLELFAVELGWDYIACPAMGSFFVYEKKP